jgi:hypothetical protein
VGISGSVAERVSRYDRECGSARCQLQKSTAGKFHDVPPEWFCRHRLSVRCTHRESIVAFPFALVSARLPLGSRTLVWRRRRRGEGRAAVADKLIPLVTS